MRKLTLLSGTPLRLAAAALGVGAAATLAIGAGPMPSLLTASATDEVRSSCDEPSHETDDRCISARTESESSSTSDLDRNTTSSTSTTLAGSDDDGGTVAPGTRTVPAGDAGSITVAVDDGVLRLVATNPNGGWSVKVDQAGGREIEVRFRAESVRVDVNVELEDGEIRERVRTRDDATDERTEVINGSPSSDDDDSSGRGDDHDDEDDDDDSSGHGDDD